jgi:hypothetical protein
MNKNRVTNIQTNDCKLMRLVYLLLLHEKKKQNNNKHSLFSLSSFCSNRMATLKDRFFNTDYITINVI